MAGIISGLLFNNYKGFIVLRCRLGVQAELNKAVGVFL